MVSELDAAYQDARMLAEYLQEVWSKAEDEFSTERQNRLAAQAKAWAGEELARHLD